MTWFPSPDAANVSTRSPKISSSAWEVSARPIVADLAEPDSVTQIFAELQHRHTRVDVLVNNAGYTLGGRFAETVWDDQERFLRVLALAPTELTHCLLPGMIERRWGRILNVASISALAPSSPQSVLYCASKSLLHKFTEGLAIENAEHNVTCTVSMPGFTATEIFQASGWGGGIENSRAVRALMMAPETVARQAYSAMMAGRPTVVHGWQHEDHRPLVAACPSANPAPAQRIHRTPAPRPLKCRNGQLPVALGSPQRAQWCAG